MSISGLKVVQLGNICQYKVTLHLAMSLQAEHSADASIRTIDLDQSEAEHLDGALMNSLKLSESDMDAVDSSVIKDLFVTVDDPEKHVGGYVSYAVKTKVRAPYIRNISCGTLKWCTR